MATKKYDWGAKDGVHLPAHSARKHAILRDYLRRYLLERCKNPNARGLRLLVVDGFAGAGAYQDGAPGSPVILLRTILDVLTEINVGRLQIDMPTLTLDCLLVLNDCDAAAIARLRDVMAEVEREAAARSDLSLRVCYKTVAFETLAPAVEEIVTAERFRNVFLNLDQYAYKDVQRATLTRLMHCAPSVELLYTCGIQSLLTYLSQRHPELTNRALCFLNLDLAQQPLSDAMLNKPEFLGAMERLVFDALAECAPFVSPFSIHNPEGWRYWLVHMATVDRARQVYNDVLHDNATGQAHYGRAGLRMLQYDPRHEDGRLYLFDSSAREAARGQLPDDVGRLLDQIGREVPVDLFWQTVYKQTPAHSDDVDAALMAHPEISVHTSKGGERRAARAVARGDTIRLRPQRSFHMLW